MSILKLLNVPQENHENFIFESNNYYEKIASDDYLHDEYIKYIDEFHFSEQYLKRAELFLSNLIEDVHSQLKLDSNCIGKCLQVTDSLQYLLQKAKIHSYIVQGSLLLSFSDSLKVFDFCQNRIGHSWLVAPPFGIIDPTFSHQNYTEQQKKIIDGYLLKFSKDLPNQVTDNIGGIIYNDVISLKQNQYIMSYYNRTDIKFIKCDLNRSDSLDDLCKDPHGNLFRINNNSAKDFFDKHKHNLIR